MHQTIFCIPVLTQSTRDMKSTRYKDCEMFSCFMTFEKSFDNKKHGSLMEWLGVESVNRQITENLCFKQKSNVRIEGEIPQLLE